MLDDGSTDNTTAVVGDFIKQDERIQLVSLRHHGPWVTKNHGLCCARGHFTTFIDSDDEYLASHLERRAAYLARHSTVDLIHGGLEIIGDQYVVDKDDISKKIQNTEYPPMGDHPLGDMFHVSSYFLLSCQLYQLTSKGLAIKIEE